MLRRSLWFVSIQLFSYGSQTDPQFITYDESVFGCLSMSILITFPPPIYLCYIRKCLSILGCPLWHLLSNHRLIMQIYMNCLNPGGDQ